MFRRTPARGIVRVRVDSRLHLDPEAVALAGQELVDELRRLCTHANPAWGEWEGRKKRHYSQPGSKKRRFFEPEPPKYVSSARRERDGSWSFPRGRATEILAALPAELFVDDRRVFLPAPVLDWNGKPARRYQRRLIDDGLDRASARDWVAGVWRSPPATGKTNAVLELVGAIGLRSLVVVPTQAIFAQWEKRACEAFGAKNVGLIQGQRRTIGNLVTIGMQRTLWNVADEDWFKTSFGALIFDEVQLGAARTYQDVIDRSHAAFRLGVSGDERRADGQEFLIYDQFGAASQVVTLEEAEAEGGAVPVELVVVPTEFDAGWYRQLPSGKKFTRRAELLDQITKDPERNKLALDLAVACHEVDHEQVIVLAGRVDHVTLLDAALARTAPSVSLVGGDREFEENRLEFAAGRSRFAVGTFGKIGVGFESHPELARGVIVSPVASSEKSEMQFNQYKGRYARPAPGKTFARIYYLLDHKVFGKRPARLLKSWFGQARTKVLLDGMIRPVDEWLRKNDEKKLRDDDRDTDFFAGFE